LHIAGLQCLVETAFAFAGDSYPLSLIPLANLTIGHAMETPLEITFHNMPSSKRIEADIRKRVAKLDKLYGRLISCRVSVELRSKRHRTGNVYEVHVELLAPRGLLVVSREPHHVKERHAHADVLTSVRDAFNAAEARLVEYKKKRLAKERARRRASAQSRRQAETAAS